MALAAVILAAGKGTRMTSDLPKVVHTVNDRPMVALVIDTVEKVPADRICVVVGYRAELVEAACRGKQVELILQAEQLGTGHAVVQCEKTLEDFEGTVIVLNGDVPCLQPGTIQEFVAEHHRTASAATVLTTIIDAPKGYGRIVRDAAGSLLKIVEEKDASDDQRQIREINSGLFCFDKKELFDILGGIDCNNAQGEYYLTDVIALLKAKDRPVAAFCIEDQREVAGVNTDEELEEVRKFYKGSPR
jgi:bifunctional UDP-N-acetylglucosamine pyrophosphorylase/glucosamine-1-phosphate N-acetyltransferase